ncbi:MAG: DUF1638 domain-containing protein [Deltaproteobacteria bacterium]|jgi:hypothetical protein|nr:DUF1638 domain-containing protein [Deltaproteobacteria bacterium]
MKKTLIACNIFEDEMNDVLKRRQDLEVEIVWIGAGPHNDMDRLKKSLDEAFLKADLEKGDVRVLLGGACLPDLKDLAREKGFRLLSTKKRMGALFGEKKVQELEKDKTMVATPSWIRKTWFSADGIRSLLGWDDTDFRINFGRCDRVLVIDFGINPLSDEEILESYSVIEAPIETDSMPLEHFEKVFLDFLA